MDDVTALVVFCCCEKLIKPCLDSFRKFYPNIKLLIVDNSNVINHGHCLSCTESLKEYCKNDPMTELHMMPFNIGHGLGLHYGITEVSTKYVYIFEPDTIHILPNLIENMLKMVNKETYGVGRVVQCPYIHDIKQGKNITLHSRNRKFIARNRRLSYMKMLWLYSGLIVIKRYSEFPPFDSHEGCNADPIRKASQAIHNTGKNLYVDFNVDKYVLHTGGGSRTIVGIPHLNEEKNGHKLL